MGRLAVVVAKQGVSVCCCDAVIDEAKVRRVANSRIGNNSRAREKDVDKAGEQDWEPLRNLGGQQKGS